jgi:putative tryptophan/tyrosine transport system substrate-binding protein
VSSNPFSVVWKRRKANELASTPRASPLTLPIEEPVKFDFVVNLKTAKTLGLTIPPAVLARADEIIQ